MCKDIAWYFWWCHLRTFENVLANPNKSEMTTKGSKGNKSLSALSQWPFLSTKTQGSTHFQSIRTYPIPLSAHNSSPSNFSFHYEHWRACLTGPIRVYPFLSIFNTKSFWVAWVAQRLGVCLWLRAWSRDPGLSPTSGSLHGTCFCLCLCLSLSLCVCVCFSWINKSFFKKRELGRERPEFFFLIDPAPHKKVY